MTARNRNRAPCCVTVHFGRTCETGTPVEAGPPRTARPGRCRPGRAESSMSGRRRRRTAWAGLCCLVLAVVLGACTSTAGSPPATESEPGAVSSANDIAGRAARSEELLQRTLSPDEPGCSAAVGIEGEVVWAAARGLADLATERALTPAAALAIGSVSKQFTATAVLLLAQEARLTLNDLLSRWGAG